MFSHFVLFTGRCSYAITGSHPHFILSTPKNSLSTPKKSKSLHTNFLWIFALFFRYNRRNFYKPRWAPSCQTAVRPARSLCVRIYYTKPKNPSGLSALAWILSGVWGGRTVLFFAPRALRAILYICSTIHNYKSEASLILKELTCLFLLPLTQQKLYRWL